MKLLEFHTTTNIIAIDYSGYKYRISMSNLRAGKKPNRFMNNPFAIDNLKRYLEIHHPTYHLLDDTYINCKTKMRFICELHPDDGIQYNSIDNIVHNHHTCKHCSFDEMRAQREIPTETIINHCNNLGLDYVGRFSRNNETRVKFICPKHRNKGTQEISWYHLKTSVYGCSYCAGKHITTDDFVQTMKKINSDIDIVGEYKGSEEPIECHCKICGHIWYPIGRSLKYGTGCPNCKTSKGERKIKEYLSEHDIKFIPQHTFNDCIYQSKLKFDFYIPDYKIAIEYDGHQHFFPVDFANRGKEWAERQFAINQNRDKVKNEYCAKNDITLIRIPYFKYDNIENILAHELNHVLFCCENS